MISRSSLVLAGLLVIAMLALLPPPALVLRPEAGEPPPATFEALEYRLMRALQAQDRTALEELLADDYALTSTEVTGQRLGKAAYVRATTDAGGMLIEDFTFRRISSTMVGATVALVYADVEWNGAAGGRAARRRHLLTDVWHLRDGSWKLVSRHSTRARPGG